MKFLCVPNLAAQECSKCCKTAVKTMNWEADVRVRPSPSAACACVRKKLRYSSWMIRFYLRELCFWDIFASSRCSLGWVLLYCLLIYVHLEELRSGLILARICWRLHDKLKGEKNQKMSLARVCLFDRDHAVSVFAKDTVIWDSKSLRF